MNRKATHRAVGDLAPESHRWELAAEYVTASDLEDPMRRWLRDSGLPGAVSLAEDGSWPLADRIQFLKLLCGEQE